MKLLNEIAFNEIAFNEIAITNFLQFLVKSLTQFILLLQ